MTSIEALNKTDVAGYDSDGYVMLRGFVQDAPLDELIANVNRFIDVVVPGLPSEQVFYENKSDPTTLKQIQKMADHDGWFYELFHDSPFRLVAEALLRGPVVPINLQYFNKPPGVGLPTPPHQDGYYFMIAPREAVTMWLTLDEVDGENGCVRYVPGSHKRGMRDHARTQTLGFSQGIVDYPTPDDQQRELPMPAMPGDLLVHHAMTIHRADQNQSKTRTRKALGFIYYSERARQDTAAHEAYQRKLAEEMKSIGKI